MKDLRIINVVDVEATCWDAAKGSPKPENEETEIIEIGIVELDLRTFARRKKTSYLIKPTRSKVSPFCTELTTITQAMLDEYGITYEQACAHIRGTFRGLQRPWCSWGAYDRDMFDLEARRRVFAGTASITAQQLASSGALGWPADVYPLSRQHTNMKQVLSLAGGRFDGEFGMAHACSLAGLTLEGTHHRGHDDAWNTAAIVTWMLATTRSAFPFRNS